MIQHEVLDALRDLLPTIRSRRAEADELRRLPHATVRDLIEAGAFRLLQPRRFGGHEADPRVFYAASVLLGSACGATGWTFGVVGVHPWQLGLFPARAQDEVWADDPNMLVSSTYAPTGQVEAVDGGYRLRGRWNFSSGADHCGWVFLGGAVHDANGQALDFGTFLLPQSDYVIDDVWDTIGLRGSGSNDIVVADAFVPAHRMLSFKDTAVLRCPGQEVNPGPLYRLPFASMFSYAVTSSIIGMGRGIIDEHIAMAKTRMRHSYGEKVASDPFALVRIAEASAEVDASELQMMRDIGELYERAVSGERITSELRLRTRRDQVMGTKRALNAIDRLFENSGGHALYAGNDIQRCFRDAHAARGHVINDTERGLLLYGRHLMGEEVFDPMI